MGPIGLSGLTGRHQTRPFGPLTGEMVEATRGEPRVLSYALSENSVSDPIRFLRVLCGPVQRLARYRLQAIPP